MVSVFGHAPTDTGARGQEPREIHDHPPAGAVLLGASQKRVYLTPRGEGRVIKWTQHGPMPYLSDDVMGYVSGVGCARGVVSRTQIRHRSFRESKSEELHPPVVGDCQLGPSLEVEVSWNWNPGPQEIWLPLCCYLVVKFQHVPCKHGTPILWPVQENAAVKLDLRTAAVNWVGAVKLDLIAELDLSFTPVSYSAAVSPPNCSTRRPCHCHN